jgi:hypothetical protein
MPLLNRLGGAAASYVYPAGVIRSTVLADACLLLATGRGWAARTEEHAIENAGLKTLAAEFAALG